MLDSLDSHTVAPPASESVDAPHAVTSGLRLLSLLAVLSVLGTAAASWGAPLQLPVTGVLVAVVFGVGVVATVAIIAARRLANLRRLDVLVCALGLTALIAEALVYVHLNPGYGTDEGAFQQAAGTLLLHGHDPYGANLIGALSRYHVSPQVSTSLLNGSVVSTFGYPSVPILVAAAAVWITGGTQAIPIADIVILALTTVALFTMLAPAHRPVVVLLCIGLPTLFGLATLGTNVIICMALLSMVAYRWSEVGANGTLTGGQRLQAVALGLAIATQQLAWFATPFLLVGIYLLRRGSFGKRAAAALTARYVAWAAGAFLAVNAPFIIWSAHSWVTSVAAPLLQHAIPYGQGLIDLTLILHVGGGNLEAYQICAALVYLALLATYILHFRLLARGCFALAIIPLFYASRSLSEYFIALAVVIVVSVITVPGASLAHAPHVQLPAVLASSRRPLTAALFAPAAAALAIALTAQAPFAIKITGFRTAGASTNLWKLHARIHNTSATALTPRFATDTTGQASTPWIIMRGPRTLPPRETASYVLYAPNVASMPSVTSPVALEAFTVTPATFSSSRSLTPVPYTLALTPAFVNNVLPDGTGITLTLQLLSPDGAALHRKGVVVAFQQAIETQGQPVRALARINGSRPGLGTVHTRTDALGQARFRVEDSRPQSVPIYFQGRVQSPAGYLAGYSNRVSVIWR